MTDENEVLARQIYQAVVEHKAEFLDIKHRVDAIIQWGIGELESRTKDLSDDQKSEFDTIAYEIDTQIRAKLAEIKREYEA